MVSLKVGHQTSRTKESNMREKDEERERKKEKERGGLVKRMLRG